jgi:hypothetical protein
MSSPENASAAALATERGLRHGVDEAYAAVREQLAGSENVTDISTRGLQRLLAVAVKEFSDRQQNGERSPIFSGEDAAVGLTATDAVIVASAVLDALGVEIFELGMWKTWGTV